MCVHPVRGSEMSLPEDFLPLINATTVLIEATPFEYHVLWQRCSEEKKLSWVSPNQCWWPWANETKVEIRFAVIDGTTYAFWNPTSTIINHDDVRRFLKATFPWIQRFDEPSALYWKP